MIRFLLRCNDCSHGIWLRFFTRPFTLPGDITCNTCDVPMLIAEVHVEDDTE